MEPTILLIEDDKEMAENISSILTLAHYNVVYAENGKAGIALAEAHKPDLILCDIIMPELDGYGVLHVLSQDTVLSQIPFIFLTAVTDNNTMRMAMNMGVDDFITKPFYGLDLLKVVDIRLKKSKRIKASAQNGWTAVNGQSERPKNTNDLEKLCEPRHVRLFRKKELIFMEGQPAYDLYYIIKGTVKTYKVNYEGKELITGFHHAGDFLGYIPLLKETPHHESAEVREDAEISMVPKHEFLEIVYSNKEVAKKFIGKLSNELIEAENRLVDIAYQSVRQRVAGTLLKINNQDPACNNTVITITRKDISNMIGTATESLNRTLAEFKEEGLIEIKDDGIRILEKGKLERNRKLPNFSVLRMNARL